MPHQQAPASAGPNGYHCRGSGATIGDSHKSPLITREKPLSKNYKTETNRPANRKIRSAWPRPETKEGPRPKKPQRPTKRSVAVPLG
jgi:hypothetical protein